MEIVHSRCAGMDVSKRDAKVCVRVAGRGRRKTVETVCTWGSTTNAILTLREHLINEQVSLVVMEATGDYWKPFYYLLEDADFEVMLVNARHVKNLPGRKSDVVRCCLAGSTRRAWSGPRLVRPATSDPAAAGPDPGPHSDDPGTRPGDPTVREAVGGRRDQIVLSGQRHHRGVRPVDAASLDRRPHDPAVLADLAKRRLRAKIPELTEALTGRFSDHHAFWPACIWMPLTNAANTSQS